MSSPGAGLNGEGGPLYWEAYLDLQLALRAPANGISADLRLEISPEEPAKLERARGPHSMPRPARARARREESVIIRRVSPPKTRTNEEWLRMLTSRGSEQAEAIADLRALLLRASLYSLHRTQYPLAYLGEEDLRQLAEDSAQEACLALLKHLHEFRGESKFTTWAFKFAVNTALVRARRESWKHVSLDQLLADQELPELPFPDTHPDRDPDRSAWRAEVWRTLREVIDNELTPRQRQVLIAMTFDEVPMDELTLHLNTNRNAIYKLLHDARRKLKARLEARGLAVQEMLDLFAKS